MKKLIFILLFFTTLTGLKAQVDVDGFRNWKWGMDYSELSSRLRSSSNRLPRFKTYDKISENYNFEGIKAHSITYGFRDGIFSGVSIGIKNTDLDHIVSVFTTKYGKPKKIDTAIVVNYDWHSKSGDISITYLPLLKGNKHTTIGISKKKDKSEKILR